MSAVARLRATVVALGCLLVVTSCSAAAPPAGGGFHAWTHPDTVRVGIWEEPHTLDPVVSTMDFEDDIFQLVFDGLVRYDDHGRAIPDLAREAPTLANGGVSRDGLTITYHLMPNVKWHDGAPLTSADVVYTWQQIMNPQNNTPNRTGYDRIASIDTPDPLTVRVHLRERFAPAIYLFACGSIGSIIPKHILSRFPNLNRTNADAHPVGSGAYVFASWTHGSELRFDANPQYFRGPPKIAHVVMKVIPDQNTMINALRTHDIDLYYQVNTAQAPIVKGIPDTTFLQTPSLAYEKLTFNTAKPPLDDVRVRIALAHAMDADAIFDKVYHRLGGRGPMHYAPGMIGYDPALHYYSYSPSLAANELDAAGWKLGAGGIRMKNGVPLTFTVSSVTGNKLREQLEVLLQGYWRAIGADADVKNYPAATFFTPYAEGGPIYTGKFNIALATSSRPYPDPDDINSLASTSIPPGGRNTAHFRNAEVDRLLTAGLLTYDASKRDPMYRRIAKLVVENLPEYTMSLEPQIMVANNDLHGLAPGPIGSDLWNAREWSFAPHESR